MRWKFLDMPHCRDFTLGLQLVQSVIHSIQSMPQGRPHLVQSAIDLSLHRMYALVDMARYFVQALDYIVLYHAAD